MVILGFHADNGSEDSNDQVALVLETLRIECTTSRPRQSNDHALAESKTGAVVRKHLGSAHLPHPFATQVNACCAHHLNPYVNFHRPGFFPETSTDTTGKERTRDHDRDMKTPYEKLKPLPDVRQYLNGHHGGAMGCTGRQAERHGGGRGLEPRTKDVVPDHRGGKPEAGMSHTRTAERRSLDQPNRGSTESRDSDSPTVVQTHFWIGKYCQRPHSRVAFTHLQC